MYIITDLKEHERRWLCAYLDKRLVPYRSLVAPALLEVMRQALFEFLAIDPETRRLIRQLARPSGTTIEETEPLLS